MISFESMSRTYLCILGITFCGIRLFTGSYTTPETKVVRCSSQSQKPYSSSGVKNNAGYCWIHWFACATVHLGTYVVVAPCTIPRNFLLGSNSIICCQTFSWFASKSVLPPISLSRLTPLIVSSAPLTVRTFIRCSSLARLTLLLHTIAACKVLIMAPQSELWLIPRPRTHDCYPLGTRWLLTPSAWILLSAWVNFANRDHLVIWR